MKKLISLVVVVTIQCFTLNIQNSFAQAPFSTPDNKGAGNCLSFDGANDWVQVPNHSSISFTTGDFTVETWVRFDDLSLGAILAKYVNLQSFYRVITDGTDIEFSIREGTAPYIRAFTSITPYNDNNWHKITGVRDATNNQIRLYVDGELKGTAADNTGDISNNGSLGIGYDNHHSSLYFTGQIDEVSMWNRALTQTEIRDNMCLVLNGNETGLIAYWNMNEGTGSTVSDLTTNANHGTRQ